MLYVVITLVCFLLLLSGLCLSCDIIYHFIVINIVFSVCVFIIVALLTLDCFYCCVIVCCFFLFLKKNFMLLFCVQPEIATLLEVMQTLKKTEKKYTHKLVRN